ncbi:tRNA uridine-5-carboxymethylaminomethyl(34) synthesis GTPase MnmE [Sphingomonas turrisvirgatae]|uniref:tRNA modification GTPase MnmE n=1 Tax=Sphingomonas turrisvirgatae TaxID=1888892 RepID=A0A1E3LT24_9SPHN|nr:tRNA uridine-5-carboxymethylaminomethyl(34) synthesis GTPase MnmE [Sphingomonas turrisvirgatae]ODP35970.1 tRNA uridine-5-carboxymethylaminomethyl(34) synthesis GTPase MnmE [Sphingomonas turrisvirgatae]
MNDTIYAISSGAPPAAIAVMRLSGPGAFAAVERLAGTLPQPRRASLRTLRAGDEVLDRALVLLFPGPATATGEDLAELHLHGGRAIVRAVSDALAAMPGMRPAEAGEFTRRALFNGRIDLTEAEGLADLLAAETEMQRRAAIRAAEGGIRRLVEQWAARTVQLSALVEAALDHADEDDVSSADSNLAELIAELSREIDGVAARPGSERLRDGVRIVLAGQPNAGKSTLLNALVDRDAAIVSPLAGTTRDRIEVPIMRNGIAYLLIDTAGLNETPADQVEEIGIARARQSIGQADLLLWLNDVPPPAEPVPVLWLNPRSDLPDRDAEPERLSVSALTGEGMAELWQAIEEAVAALLPAPDAVALNQRQRMLASAAASHLRAASSEPDQLLQAERLRAAMRSFHAITGAIDVEAMLDALFGQFCIGK